MSERGAETQKDSVPGLLYAVAAYGSWGIIPIFFKAVSAVPPLEILAQRVFWSAAMLVPLAVATRRFGAIREIASRPRTIRFLLASTLLIGCNWFVFIWAVTTSHIVDASLGYFMNPLVNVLLGFVFLGERLGRIEWISVALAAAGVLWITVTSGVVPWISLVLAVTFGLYGLMRKLAHVGAMEGLTVETILLAPAAIWFLLLQYRAGQLEFASGSTYMNLMLMASGPVTALPLLWFAAAIRRIRLATAGLLQYIAPTIQFTIAVALYGEPLRRERLVGFLLIWTAIALYAGANVRRRV